MDDIEEGRHTLTPAGGPYLVICERGAHAGLATRYLRADGLQAEAWKGTPAGQVHYTDQKTVFVDGTLPG